MNISNNNTKRKDNTVVFFRQKFLYNDPLLSLQEKKFLKNSEIDHLHALILTNLFLFLFSALLPTSALAVICDGISCENVQDVIMRGPNEHFDVLDI